MSSRRHAPANTPDHRPVPRQERGECQLGHVALQGHEPLQEWAVAQPGKRPHAAESLNLT